VVGSAGGADRCRYVVEELGFDACVDHAAGDLEGRLREVLPSGLDVYFDNVGGSHLRAALALANPYGRFVECGMISSYGGSPEPVDNLSLVVGKRLTLRGFLVRDAADRAPLFLRHVGGLLRDGSVRYDETVVEGIEHQFDALRDLLRGGAHRGKLVVDVRGD
jgi:NADPH-dependent curcumin reductase CurA